jgi:hypothetical protein
MKPLIWRTLFRREWLQHRFAWAMLALVPLLLGVLLVTFGSVQADEPHELMPLVLTLAALAAGAGSYFALALVTAVILLAGLARRDHSDRSVEFWLSMPAGPTPAWTVPLVTHLLLVPMAAIMLGLLAGGVWSSILVARVSGFGAWFTLPWADVLGATLSMLTRVLAGVLLAAVWLSPIVLSMVLLTAWLGRWGLVALFGGVGVLSMVMEIAFKQPWPIQVVGYLLQQAGKSFVLAGSEAGLVIEGADQLSGQLPQVARWAFQDLGAAFSLLASPPLLGVLAFSALCFAGLVDWRRRGAGTANG